MVSLDIRSRVIADDNLTLLHTALMRLGMASLPAYVAQEALESCALQRVLTHFESQENWFKPGRAAPKNVGGTCGVDRVALGTLGSQCAYGWRERTALLCLLLPTICDCAFRFGIPKTLCIC